MSAFIFCFPQCAFYTQVYVITGNVFRECYIHPDVLRAFAMYSVYNVNREVGVCRYIGGTQRHYKGRFVGFRHVRRQIDACQPLQTFFLESRATSKITYLYIVVFIDYRLRARDIYLQSYNMYRRRLRLHISIHRQKHRERSYSNVVIRLYTYIRHTFSTSSPKIIIESLYLYYYNI